MSEHKYDELFIATTDTIPGIGAPVSIKNKEAIYDLKQRSKDKGLIIFVSSIEMAKKYKDFDHRALVLAEKYWPGATTIVCSDELALRMPDNTTLLRFIESQGPLYMTSANISNQKHLSFEEAKEAFQEITSYYDFGKGSGKPSRIIDARTGEFVR